MADPAAYNFDPEEIVTALLKHQGIHEGTWTFGVNFGLAVSNIGKNPEDQQMRPGIICQVDGVSLNRAAIPVPGLTYDAAQLNPRKK